MTTLDHPGVTARHRSTTRCSTSLPRPSSTCRLPRRCQPSCTRRPRCWRSNATCSSRRNGCASAAPNASPKPGDWFTVTICDEPIIVARDKSGEVRAMSRGLSAPRHAGLRRRGNSLDLQVSLPPLELRARRAVARCPGDGAHGRLRQEPTTACRHWRSRSGRGSSSSTSTSTPPRSLRRSPSTSRTSTNYDLDDAVCPGTFTLENMPWNWKVMFENFNDGYHANRLHQFRPGLLPEPSERVPGRVGPRRRTSCSAPAATPTPTAASTRPTRRSCRSSRN